MANFIQISKLLPLPPATSIPTGPLKLSTHPGIGSLWALITLIQIKHQYTGCLPKKLRTYRWSEDNSGYFSGTQIFDHALPQSFGKSVRIGERAYVVGGEHI